MKNSKSSKNLRFNFLTLVTIVIGFILLIRLFNLQIINGNSYYTQATSRLVRQTVIEAPRGEILDRNRNQNCY